MSGVRLNPALQGFRCLRCDARYPVRDLFEGCLECARQGHAASVVATYEGGPDDSAQRTPLLGVPCLGEGGTPLIPLPEVAETLEMDRVWLKAEGQNPTGSHKDRLSPLVVARAAMLGQRRIVASSSGNAGVSLAAYSARAGLECTIFTRAGSKGTWGRDIVELGAELMEVATSAQRWVRTAELARSGRAYPATNYVTPAVGSNPFGVQGYKTLGHELAAKLGHDLPDAVFVPTARGDLLWGIWEGLCESRARNPPARYPKMIAVEPFARAVKVLDGADYRERFPGATEQVSTNSVTVTWQTVHTLRASAGLAVVVDDTEAAAARVELARQGILLERCSAAPLVALRRLRASGVLPPGSRAVLIGTSDGRREERTNRPGATT